MAAALSFASASLAESATAAPQLASPALAVKAGRQRGLTCGVVGICEHGRQRSRCKECGGGGICEHGRRRSQCKECGGGGICEHGRRRSECKECGGGRQETILLEATAVEVDEDAEPDEWIPTVQSHIVVAARPRGGKRKRCDERVKSETSVRWQSIKVLL